MIHDSRGAIVSDLNFLRVSAAPVAPPHLGAPPGAGPHHLWGGRSVLRRSGDIREDQRHHGPLRRRVHQPGAPLPARHLCHQAGALFHKNKHMSMNSNQHKYLCISFFCSNLIAYFRSKIILLQNIHLYVSGTASPSVSKPVPVTHSPSVSVSLTNQSKHTSIYTFMYIIHFFQSHTKCQIFIKTKALNILQEHEKKHL